MLRVFVGCPNSIRFLHWRHFAVLALFQCNIYTRTGQTGFARPVLRMRCKSGWIRFLNRFPTHPVELISRELGDFLTKLLLFRKDDFRQRLYQDALSGSGPGLRPLRRQRIVCVKIR
jgi:hypothetical protein